MTPGCLNEHTKVSALVTLAGVTLAQATQTFDKTSMNTDKAAGNTNKQTPGFQSTNAQLPYHAFWMENQRNEEKHLNEPK